MTSRIYLAGPFFSEKQIERLSLIHEKLTNNPSVGYIYEPSKHQQDTIIKKYGDLEKAMCTSEWQSATYRADVQAIHQSNAVVAVLDFNYETNNLLPDPGTIYEIGYAQAIGKPIILIQSTDVKNDPLNLMLTQYTAYFDHNDINGFTPNKLENYDFRNFPQLNNSTRIVF